MKIAIASDSHDNIVNLRKCINECNARNISLLIHCGDLISPFMLTELSRFNGDVHLIYGNNVGDQHLISSRCGTIFPSITHHGIMGEIEAGGLKIAFTHYPRQARGLAYEGGYDVVCCGHNHRAGCEQINNTLLINGGQLLGKDEEPGMSILDCDTLQVERVNCGEQMLLDE
jgi:putative phosphoesterase